MPPHRTGIITIPLNNVTMKDCTERGIKAVEKLNTVQNKTKYLTRYVSREASYECVLL